MSVSKIIVIVFIIGCIWAVAFAGGDSMSIVVNRLMLEGYTPEQIEVMKKYPKWPTYDKSTGLLVDGPQRFVSPDFRLAVLYHVQTIGHIQTIKKEVIYGPNKK